MDSNDILAIRYILFVVLLLVGLTVKTDIATFITLISGILLPTEHVVSKITQASL
jgi:hypothetical protein